MPTLGAADGQSRAHEIYARRHWLRRGLGKGGLTRFQTGESSDKLPAMALCGRRIFRGSERRGKREEGKGKRDSTLVFPFRTSQETIFKILLSKRFGNKSLFNFCE